MKVGNHRIIEKNTEVFSISNQSNIILTKDTIVKINHTVHFDNESIFVKPMQEIGLTSPVGPSLIGLGSDEWVTSFKKTKKYKKGV